MNASHGAAVCCLLATIILPLASDAADASRITIENISPTASAHVDNGSVGGRVNKLSGLLGSNVVFAASEWGGLFKSTDGGLHWQPVAAFLPRVTTAVAVSPSDPNRAVATSFYDGRVQALSGVAATADGGHSWSYIDWARLTQGIVCEEGVKVAPAGAGISVDPQYPQHVIAATNCGLAISEDGGGNWQLSTADPKEAPGMVWDVVARNGQVYGCGDDGFFWLKFGANHWNYPDASSSVAPPNGRCSLAVSPDHPDHVFETVGEHVYESLNGGTSWMDGGQPEKGSSRIPFLAAVRSTQGAFQLWYGDTGLLRRDCLEASADGTHAVSCFDHAASDWTGGLGEPNGAHDDAGDLVFSATGHSFCPRLFASDGGIYLNTEGAFPACTTPHWQAPEASPQALWVMAFAGAHASHLPLPILHTGAQDNGLTTGTPDQTGRYTWGNTQCCDTFDVVTVDAGARIIFSECCWLNDVGGYDSELILADVNGLNSRQIADLPGALLKWIGKPTIASFGSRGLVILTDKGVFATTDATANTVKWSPVGASRLSGGCSIQTAINGARISLFVLSGSCNGIDQDTVSQYSSVADLASKWNPIRPPENKGGIGIFAVDPVEPNRVIVSRIDDKKVAMFRTEDGGKTWLPMPELDALMTGNGKLEYYATRGDNDWDSFGGYTQPRVVAFNPLNHRVVVAGGTDSGLFISFDYGISWRSITRPIAANANPEVTRPMAVYFDGTPNKPDIYVATQGSGVWRVSGIDVP